MAMTFGLMKAAQERARNETRVIAELPRKGGKTAMIEAASQPSGKLAGQQLAALVSASLAEDLAALKSLNSVERKIAHKRDTLIPKYEDYVARLRVAGSTHELLGYWLVWLFDVGMIEDALEYASWAFETGLKLPERFKSEPRFFVATQLAEWAETEWNAGHQVEPYFGDTFAAIEAEPDVWNLTDETLGRYCRLRGLMAEQAGDLELAKSSLERALGLGAKVKTALANVEKKLSRENDAPASGNVADPILPDDVPITD